MWEQAGILGDPWGLGGSGAGLCASLALGLALYQMFVPPSDVVRDRIARAVEPVAGATGAPRTGALLAHRARDRFASSGLARMLRMLSRIARPDNEEEVSRSRARLEHAGLRGEH